MKNRFIIIAIAMLASLVSCDKFLDTMPDNRAEVDSKSKIHALLTSGYPVVTYLTITSYLSDDVDKIGDDIPNSDRYIDQIYNWEEVTETDNDDPTEFWGNSWLCIAHANQALDAIYTLTGTSSIDDAATIAAKGYGAELAEALLIRAYSHFMLVNTFCLNYNKQTSATDLGIPYMEGLEQELNPKYERSNVAKVYEKIQKDLEIALQYVSDSYYTVPKYHFNARAAYAFAARFYLFSEQWEKASDYATRCLGSQPATVLRNWEALGKLERDWDVISYEFVKSSYDANLLLLTSYSAFGYYFCYPGQQRYSHNSYLAFTEDIFAKNVWGNTAAGYQPLSNWFFLRPGWYNGATYDLITNMTIPYMFEYTDPVARIGYAHAVCPAFTTDETLLNRAEAYVMQHEYDKATADINTYIRSIVKPANFPNDLSTEGIVNFYSAIGYGTWDNPTIKKKLNPAFNIGADGGVQESMLQCVLGMKRINQLGQGLRWYDVKRYGIEIWRRTLEPDPKAGQYDAALKPKRLDDVLLAGDPRRAVQLPKDVIAAGMEPNPRTVGKPADRSLKPKDIPAEPINSEQL